MKLPDQNYILNRIRIEPQTGCWIWNKAIGKSGYGVMRIGAFSAKSVHRIVWELWNGSIPSSMQVCHKCDRKVCCNPSHLFLGTRSENMRDWYRKGLGPSGINHPRAKIRDWNTIDTIRSIDGKSVAQIGRDYGLNPTIVYRIRVGLTYAT